MKKILVSFIQDRSGSMADVWAETLNGFKSYVEDLQADQKKDNEVEYLFSLTTFDTVIETPYMGVAIDRVDSTELNNHGPRGGTALYDAIGKTLQAVDDDKKLSFEKAIVVIVTDGQENSSREWSKQALHAAIDERIKRGNWTFTYLGTQPETWDDASSLGMGVGASAVYTPTNAGATYRAMASASASMARSAQGQSVSFLHDNTTVASRSFVGMKTATDDDPSGLGVGVSSAIPGTSSSIPGTPRQAPPAKPRSTSSTTRRWK